MASERRRHLPLDDEVLQEMEVNSSLRYILVETYSVSLFLQCFLVSFSGGSVQKVTAKTRTKDLERLLNDLGEDFKIIDLLKDDNRMTVWYSFATFYC